MTDLKDKIKQDYIELSQKDKHIQALIKKLEDGKAAFNDVDSITKATGHALKTALEKNIAENPAAFADEKMLADILRETFGDNYELINTVAADVQKRLDKVQGINIKPQKAEFPEERVDNLAKFTAKQDLTRKKSVSEVGAAAENLNNSMYTDYVKANADFRSRAGLKVYVIRTSDGKCCEWCDKQVGKYVYPDIPKDVWRRHKRCTCEITYVNERAGTYDRISFHDSIDPEDGKKLVTNKQITRLTPEQAAAKEREILDKKPLTFGRKSDIIEADKYKSFSNGDEVNEFFGGTGGLLERKKSVEQQWLKSLTRDETAYVRSYAADGYDDINKYLRKTGDWEDINKGYAQQAINNIDSAISKFELKENITVYRGIDIDTIGNMFPDAEDFTDLIGKQYTDKGYMSSSPLKSVAKEFAEENGRDGVLLKLDIPKGNGKGAYINKLAGQYKDVEYEFLIKRNSKFKIYEIDENGDIPILKARWFE